MLPGFGPAAECIAWCVPKGATFVVEAKKPKTSGTPPEFLRLEEREPVEGEPTPEFILSYVEGLKHL